MALLLVAVITAGWMAWLEIRFAKLEGEAEMLNAIWERLVGMARKEEQPEGGDEEADADAEDGGH